MQSDQDKKIHIILYGDFNEKITNFITGFWFHS